MLDDLGLLVAIEAWLERRRGGGLLIASEFAIPAPEQGRTGLDPELETTIDRLPQEALTNIGKNAGACTVCIQVAVAEGLVKSRSRTTGSASTSRPRRWASVLPGMRDGVYLANGTLEIETGRQGTLLLALLPARNT